MWRFPSRVARSRRRRRAGGPRLGDVCCVRRAAELEEACGGRHALVEAPADLAAYAETGLPARSMGRSLEEDPLFYAAPLAAGAALRGKG